MLAYGNVSVQPLLMPAPQIRLVRQLRALQVFVIHSFIHSFNADIVSNRLNISNFYNFYTVWAAP